MTKGWLVGLMAAYMHNPFARAPVHGETQIKPDVIKARARAKVKAARKQNQKRKR